MVASFFRSSLLTYIYEQDWPLWWKVVVLLNISFYNALGNMFAAGITALFGLIIQDFHCTVVEASRLSSYALLALGLSVLGSSAQYVVSSF